jgi:hypothetical protein
MKQNTLRIEYNDNSKVENKVMFLGRITTYLRGRLGQRLHKGSNRAIKAGDNVLVFRNVKSIQAAYRIVAKRYNPNADNKIKTCRYCNSADIITEFHPKEALRVNSRL